MGRLDMSLTDSWDPVVIEAILQVLPNQNRAFADRSNLRAHLQTHSEMKRYQCACCLKTFSRISLLAKHQEAGCPVS
ncbi:hypothetical protein D4764_11G0001780 [Takifugu flavidus]|uniref:C2H2-type domain-containing protein n=1 Tax=Takifugu flavidus TaxID=433684 RepID=A0A5C6PI11_9TELE|nr:hypothetical protein D4764_11G0001780 [Takifugu flavidus]